MQVVQSCDRMVNSGISYMEECRSFSVSVKELSSHFEKGESVSVSHSIHNSMCIKTLVTLCTYTTGT